MDTSKPTTPAPQPAALSAADDAALERLENVARVLDRAKIEIAARGAMTPATAALVFRTARADLGRRDAEAQARLDLVAAIENEALLRQLGVADAEDIGRMMWCSRWPAYGRRAGFAAAYRTAVECWATPQARRPRKLWEDAISDLLRAAGLGGNARSLRVRWSAARSARRPV